MSESIIEARNLSRQFGTTVALDNVNLTIPRGMVFGLVGENGAGKTTLIRHILGLLRAEQGTVTVFGHDPVADPVRVLMQVGYLSEERDLPDWMRVGELLRYTQAFFPSWDPQFANELLEMFGLDERQKVKRLSRGQRARAGLLIALAHRPDLLVLDEPSSGLDPIVRRDILTAIIRTVAEEGRTVLFSSHLLDEVERVADWLAILHCGRLVLNDQLDKVLASHRRLTVRFAEPQSVEPPVTGALDWSGDGREWTVLCNGMSENLKQQVRSLGGEVIDENPATLDEIFVARIEDERTF